MKNRFIQILSLLLAAMLQLAPLMRSILPTQGLAPSAWGFILKIGVGATALLGFDAVSQASSMALSPANATVGASYSGVISYSGHSSSVSSESCNGNCLYGGGTITTNGLTVSYDGHYSLNITGIPTKTNTIYLVCKVYKQSACGTGSYTYSQTLALLVNPSGGAASRPTPTAAPQNQIAQVGTDVDLSGGFSGNPIPQYQWWRGLTPMAGQNSSVLHLANVQLTNCGTYTLTASNSTDVGEGILTLPSATCILSTCISGGTNFSALNYTNFAPAGVAISIYSYVTNAPGITNNYNWYYNGSGVSISPSNTLPISAAQLTPLKGGDYSVLFTNSLTNSSGQFVGQVIPPSGTNIYNFQVTAGQWFDSYWAFGYLPMFTNSLPASTNVNAGSNVTFTIAVGGTLNVYTLGGSGATYSTNNVDPCVFWYQNGTLIASQNYVCGPVSLITYTNNTVNASLTLNNVTSANNGNYTVVATNFWGSVTSSPVALTVVSSASPPGFTVSPPAALSLLAGQSSAISVTVTGTPPISYQWRKNGANLANGGVYAGVLTNTLTLTAVTNGNSGNYTVAVTNTAGAITSSVAIVNIATPPAVTAGAGTPGQLQLSANTLTGLTYVVQMATNLIAPVWIPVLTNGTGPTGTISFQTNTTSGLNRFYQLKFQ